MPLQIDTHVLMLDPIREIADAFQLTPYDAAYFELAQRRRLTLATLDAHFVRAARRKAPACHQYVDRPRAECAEGEVAKGMSGFLRMLRSRDDHALRTCC